MRFGQRPADDTPCSAFVREMRAALRRRLDAETADDRRAADAWMADVMRVHLGPGGGCRGTVDRKLASCGRDE